ncbi:uncharacterized protein LOC143608822 [Bidens hawaiensis]|uniref:uncharacterized protein LOC143608822 n=1 Tax=Bidens hawaiensis TaxID=980011 RepID=UPI00404AB738
MLQTLDASREFSVASLKNKLIELTYFRPSYKFGWNNWVPNKVCILAWRSELERLPVLTELAKRNIGTNSVLCPVCGDLEETVEHCFVTCGLAQSVWQAISLWCKIPSIFAFSIRDLLAIYKYVKFPRKKTKMFHAICLVSFWCLWKVRNDIVFNGKMVSVVNLVGDIKALSYLWVKNRSGEMSISWDDGCGFKV